VISDEPVSVASLAKRGRATKGGRALKTFLGISAALVALTMSTRAGADDRGTVQTVQQDFEPLFSVGAQVVVDGDRVRLWE